MLWRSRQTLFTILSHWLGGEWRGGVLPSMAWNQLRVYRPAVTRLYEWNTTRPVPACAGETALLPHNHQEGIRQTVGEGALHSNMELELNIRLGLISLWGSEETSWTTRDWRQEFLYYSLNLAGLDLIKFESNNTTAFYTLNNKTVCLWMSFTLHLVVVVWEEEDWAPGPVLTQEIVLTLSYSPVWHERWIITTRPPLV